LPKCSDKGPDSAGGAVAGTSLQDLDRGRFARQDCRKWKPSCRGKKGSELDPAAFETARSLSKRIQHASIQMRCTSAPRDCLPSSRLAGEGPRNFAKKAAPTVAGRTPPAWKRHHRKSETRSALPSPWSNSAAACAAESADRFIIVSCETQRRTHVLPLAARNFPGRRCEDGPAIRRKRVVKLSQSVSPR